MQTFKAYRTFQDDRRRRQPLRRPDARRARSRRRRDPDQVLDDQLQGCAVVQRRRQDHAQVPDGRRHRHGGHGRHAPRRALQAGRQGHRARLRHGRGARRRLRRDTCACRPTGSCAAREHDGLRRDDARHRGLHGGAGDPSDAAQRPQPERARSSSTAPPAASAASPIDILSKLGYNVVAHHRQGRRRRDYLRVDRRQRSGAARRALDLAQGQAAREGDLGRRDRQPRRRHARRGCSSTIEGWRHASRAVGLAAD